MRNGGARVSATEQNLGLKHDDLKPAFDASVDQTEARCAHFNFKTQPEGPVVLEVPVRGLMEPT
jgi:hypothetical protein